MGERASRACMKRAQSCKQAKILADPWPPLPSDRKKYQDRKKASGGQKQVAPAHNRWVLGVENQEDATCLVVGVHATSELVGVRAQRQTPRPHSRHAMLFPWPAIQGARAGRRELLPS